eukprot:TRINITY_DN2778_c0_g1_i3.p1 TRINITY_DN2778_c0_g1~~TRINITY_DN2778_c0_g1_i3.p1  ORF type:complete len:1210 (+),score=269.12 TRINITY_DN2778_c0_g1_i3:150-3779(+)
MASVEPRRERGRREGRPRKAERVPENPKKTKKAKKAKKAKAKEDALAEAKSAKREERVKKQKKATVSEEAVAEAKRAEEEGGEEAKAEAAEREEESSPRVPSAASTSAAAAVPAHSDSSERPSVVTPRNTSDDTSEAAVSPEAPPVTPSSECLPRVLLFAGDHSEEIENAKAHAEKLRLRVLDAEQAENAASAQSDNVQTNLQAAQTRWQAAQTSLQVAQTSLQEELTSLRILIDRPEGDALRQLVKSMETCTATCDKLASTCDRLASTCDKFGVASLEAGQVLRSAQARTRSCRALLKEQQEVVAQLEEKQCRWAQENTLEVKMVRDRVVHFSNGKKLSLTGTAIALVASMEGEGLKWSMFACSGGEVSTKMKQLLPELSDTKCYSSTSVGERKYTADVRADNAYSCALANFEAELVNDCGVLKDWRNVVQHACLPPELQIGEESWNDCHGIILGKLQEFELPASDTRLFDKITCKEQLGLHCLVSLIRAMRCPVSSAECATEQELISQRYSSLIDVVRDSLLGAVTEALGSTARTSKFAPVWSTEMTDTNTRSNAPGKKVRYDICLRLGNTMGSMACVTIEVKREFQESGKNRDDVTKQADAARDSCVTAFELMKKSKLPLRSCVAFSIRFEGPQVEIVEYVPGVAVAVVGMKRTWLLGKNHENYGSFLYWLTEKGLPHMRERISALAQAVCAAEAREISGVASSTSSLGSGGDHGGGDGGGGRDGGGNGRGGYKSDDDEDESHEHGCDRCKLVRSGMGAGSPSQTPSEKKTRSATGDECTAICGLAMQCAEEARCMSVGEAAAAVEQWRRMEGVHTKVFAFSRDVAAQLCPPRHVEDVVERCIRELHGQWLLRGSGVAPRVVRAIVVSSQCDGACPRLYTEHSSVGGVVLVTQSAAPHPVLGCECWGRPGQRCALERAAVAGHARRVVAAGAQLMLAVKRTHARGLVHGDIKPAHVRAPHNRSPRAYCNTYHNITCNETGRAVSAPETDANARYGTCSNAHAGPESCVWAHDGEFEHAEAAQLIDYDFSHALENSRGAEAVGAEAASWCERTGRTVDAEHVAQFNRLAQCEEGCGTRRWMDPHVERGNPVDAQSDVYSALEVLKAAVAGSCSGLSGDQEGTRSGGSVGSSDDDDDDDRSDAHIDEEEEELRMRKQLMALIEREQLNKDRTADGVYKSLLKLQSTARSGGGDGGRIDSDCTDSSPEK